MGYHENDEANAVLSLHPDVTMEQLRANTGFAIEAVTESKVTAARATRSCASSATRSIRGGICWVGEWQVTGRMQHRHHPETGAVPAHNPFAAPPGRAAVCGGRSSPSIPTTNRPDRR